MRPFRLLALTLTAVATACTHHPASVRSAAAPLWMAAQPDRPSKVLVVVEENHTQGSALAGMPYLASIASAYARTTSYRAVSHPSLPNYLALAGGSTFGVHDDRGPASHHLSGPSAFDRALAGGRTAKAYLESMPAPCSPTATSRYAVKHNPWAYFSDAGPRASCRRLDLPAGTTTAGALRSDIDAGRLPTLGLLVPDICHDGHSCSLGTADTWLKHWLQLIRAGADYRAGRLAVLVTFDEDDSRHDNTVLTVVMSPYASHVVFRGSVGHLSLARYFAELSATAPLHDAATAASLRTGLHL